MLRTLRGQILATSLLAGAVFSLYAAILYGNGGSGRFDRIGVTLPQVIAIYMSMSVVAGGMIIALLPLASRRGGNYLIAIIAAAAAAVFLNLARSGMPWNWGSGDWFTLIVVALAGGPVVANGVSAARERSPGSD